MSEIFVDLEFTPNPNSLKYVCSVELIPQGVLSFKDVEAARGKSLLAESLFELDGIESLMIAKNFVTVTLSHQEKLTSLNDKIIQNIQGFLKSGKAVAEPEAFEKKSVEGQGDVEKKIIKILDEDIRPAVSMDGGDISFDRYEDGIVFLHMKGACAGCPSATATLKMGIENRLREVIPEVVEVVSL